MGDDVELTVAKTHKGKLVVLFQQVNGFQRRQHLEFREVIFEQTEENDPKQDGKNVLSQEPHFGYFGCVVDGRRKWCACKSWDSLAS